MIPISFMIDWSSFFLQAFIYFSAKCSPVSLFLVRYILAKPPMPISLSISYFNSGSSWRITTSFSSYSVNSLCDGSLSSCMIIFLWTSPLLSIRRSAVLTTSSGDFSSSFCVKCDKVLASSCGNMFYLTLLSSWPAIMSYLRVNLVLRPDPTQQVISKNPSLFLSWMLNWSFPFSTY